MDFVGGAASVSQLAVYINSVDACLHQLLQDVRTAATAVKSQRDDVNVLLKILARIKEQDYFAADPAVLVPILISISSIAQTLRNWLQQPTTIYHKLALINRKADIDKAFQILRHKCNLLVLCYSEQNNRALNRIESSLAQAISPPANSLGAMASIKEETRSATKSGKSSTSSNYDSLALRARDNELAYTRSNGSTSFQPDYRPPPRGSPSTSYPSQSQPIPEGFFSRGDPSTKAKSSTSSSHARDTNASVNILVTGNNIWETSAELFENPYQPHTDVKDEFTYNNVKGGFLKVGNEVSSAKGKEKSSEKQKSSKS